MTKSPIKIQNGPKKVPILSQFDTLKGLNFAFVVIFLGKSQIPYFVLEV